MARANDDSWDFVKEGGTYQYKEEGCVAMVLVLAVRSDEKAYAFTVKVLASDGGFEPGIQFDVYHVKEPGGYWNEMIQFYESLEYCPLPIGRPWPKALPGHEFEGLQ